MPRASSPITTATTRPASEYYLDAEPADRRSFVEVLDTRQATARPHRRAAGRRALNGAPAWCSRASAAGARAASRSTRRRRATVPRGARARRRDRNAGRRAVPADSFDVVLMGDVIEHVPDPQAACAAWRPSFARRRAPDLDPQHRALGCSPASGEAAGAPLLFHRRHTVERSSSGRAWTSSRSCPLIATGTSRQ